MTTSSKSSFIFVTCALSAMSTLSAQVVTSVGVNDTDEIIGRIQSTATTANTGYFTSVTEDRVGIKGSTGERDDSNLVYEFLLPTLPVGHTIQSFEFSVFVDQSRNHSGNDPSLDAYLIDLADPSTTGTSLFYHGASDPDSDVALLGSYNFTETGTADEPVDETATFNVSAGTPLTDLQSMYGADHIPDQTAVYVRVNLGNDVLSDLSANVPDSGSIFDRYTLNNSTANLRITSIPESSSMLFVGFAALAGLLIGRRNRR